MILGNPQQRLTEASDNYSTIVDFAKKGQPQRIQIKSLKLHNERLKQLLAQPIQSLQTIDYDRLKMLSIKYEQLVTQFEYCKSAKISRGDFLVRLRKVLDLKQNGGDSGSQIRSFDNRPPQRFSNSQHSSSSAGGIGKLRYGSKAGEQNLVRVPSVAGSSMHNAESGNFGKKQSGMIHKGSYEIREIMPTLIAPRLSDDNVIHQRINTQVSRIRTVSNNPIHSNNDFPQPLASYETLQPMKQAIERMIPNQQQFTPHTPIADLNQIQQFPRPNNQVFNSSYFPPPVSQQSIKNTKSLNSNHSQNNIEKGGMISDPQAFGTYGEESVSVHRNNIQKLFSQADVLKRDISFKSQMRSPEDRSRSKSRSKFRSTKRIRDLSEKEDLIERLAAENLALKNQLSQNENKRQKSEIQQQTFPPGTLEFQKYVISNELLKKENEEIYSKLKDLEEVIEELSKENYIYRGQASNALVENKGFVENHHNTQQNYQTNIPLHQMHYQRPYPLQSNNYPQQQSRKPFSNESERRVPRLNRPLIQLPPELGQLIDTQTHRSTPVSPVVDYQYREVHFHADYRGVTEISSGGNKSFGNNRYHADHHHSQKSKNQQSGTRMKYDTRSESPDFRKSSNRISQQAYSERHFPEVNLNNESENQEYFDDGRNRNIVNNNNNVNPQIQTSNNYNQDTSDDKYFTANNISASGDRERLLAEQSIQKRNQFEQNKGLNNNSKELNNSSSSRLYQDFPRMADNQVSDNNLFSPPLQPHPGQILPIQKSFDTFKILGNQDSNPNITPTNILRNPVQNPDNFVSANRSNLLRNKVAFYKKSLVLVRQNPDFELAFKKSELNRELDTIRIIFYVNNKRQYSQGVNFQYEYDPNLYKIKQGDKLTNVLQYSQGREELVITQNSIKQFSFIVCHLTIGATTFDFIVPVFFFKFKSGRIPPIQEAATRTINFDKQFSPQFLSTLIPLVHMNPQQYLEFMKGEKPYHGESLLQTTEGQTNLRLEWISGGLRITTHPRLINAISWTLSDI